jgi:catechol 2,3-dioxygenase-like lactoylglutathione lyase family enzyme
VRFGVVARTVHEAPAGTTARPDGAAGTSGITCLARNYRMVVTGLDHNALLSSDPARTIWFYTEILGLAVGFRPPDLTFQGAWLYAGTAPVVHIVFDRPIPSKETGAVDHLAFSAVGSAHDMAARLQRHGIEFTMRTLERTGVTQVFFRDPDHVGVEINFQPT